MDEREIRKAAMAAAKARAEIMLDPGACRDAINVEAAERAQRHLDQSFEMPTRKVDQDDNVILKQPRLTDAVEARLLADINVRITIAVSAAVEAIMAEMKQNDEIHLKVMGQVVAKLREEISAEVGSLRADIAIEKAHGDGNVDRLASTDAEG